MPCYAHACRQAAECPSLAICEAVWHLCEIPEAHPRTWFRCPICTAGWGFDTTTGWLRDPLHTRKVA